MPSEFRNTRSTGYPWEPASYCPIDRQGRMRSAAT